jgi:hypothetical protein
LPDFFFLGDSTHSHLASNQAVILIDWFGMWLAIHEWPRQIEVLNEIRRLRPLGTRKRRQQVSINGISSNNSLNYYNPNMQNQIQKFQQEFQQLGQTLQSGNMSAAQQDFATLQQYNPQGSTTSSSASSASSSTQSNNPVAQAFHQLSTDMQSGNLSAAKQDYSTLQQDFQNRSTKMHAPYPTQDTGGSQGQAVSQGMDQLGQALQSGSLSGAQQAYSTLLQTFQQFGQSTGTVSAQALQASISGLSLSA